MTVPKMEKKIYIVSGKRFYIPEETTLEQYEHIMELIADTDISINITEDPTQKTKQTTAVDIISVVRTILGSGKVAPFLSILLIPEHEEQWSPEFKENEAIMKKMGDKVFVEVIRDFFNGKTDLIITIVGSFANLVKEKSSLMEAMLPEEKV